VVGAETISGNPFVTAKEALVSKAYHRCRQQPTLYNCLRFSRAGRYAGVQIGKGPKLHGIKEGKWKCEPGVRGIVNLF